MADLVLTSSEMAKWGQRLAADDWAWVTWKWLLGDTALILLWLLFVFALIQMIVPWSRRRIVAMTGRSVDGRSIFAGVVVTWLAGTFAHAALFGSGPYGYWLQSWLGESTFQHFGSWTYTYLTLFGPLKFFF